MSRHDQLLCLAARFALALWFRGVDKQNADSALVLKQSASVDMCATQLAIGDRLQLVANERFERHRQLLAIHLEMGSAHAHGNAYPSWPDQPAAQAPVMTVESEDSAVAMSWFTAGSANA